MKYRYGEDTHQRVFWKKMQLMPRTSILIPRCSPLIPCIKKKLPRFQGSLLQGLLIMLIA